MLIEGSILVMDMVMYAAMPVLRSLRQEDYNFKASLSYIVRPFIKNKVWAGDVDELVAYVPRMHKPWFDAQS